MLKDLAKAPRGLKGQLQVPGDKSISHRAVMMGALAEGQSQVDGFLMADDCLSTIQIFRQLGVAIDVNEDKKSLTIQGAGMDGLRESLEDLDCGNSGTTMRLMSGLLAGQSFKSRLVGDASLSKRPMGRIMKPLKEMGADISGQDGGDCAPLTIRSVPSLKAINYQMPVASAQVKSAIILAALKAQGTTTIIEKAKSRNHTEVMLKLFGGDIEIDDKVIKVPGGQKLQATDIQVPGDISSAAFFLVAGLIVPGSDLTLTHVGLNPTRTGILPVIEEMGGDMTIDAKKQGLAGDIRVKHSRLRGITIEGDRIPSLIDELPVIALLATQAEGTTVIRDAAELRVKETDRIEAITTELNKMGAKITAQPDGMIIEGPTPLHGAELDAWGDHRIGMTLAIASLIAEGQSTLKGSDSINISYPEFFDQLKMLIQ